MLLLSGAGSTRDGTTLLAFALAFKRFGFRVESLGSWGWGLAFRVYGWGLGVGGLWFRPWGAGFTIQGLGLRVWV